MEESKLSVEKQKTIKVLSKFIAIISKICRIFVWIILPFMLLALILVPILISDISVKNNEVTFEGISKKVLVTEENDKTVIMYGGNKVADTDENIYKVLDIFEKNSKGKLMACSIASISVIIIIIVLAIMLLKYFEKLFRNISKNDTPFTLENALYLKKIAHILILQLIVPMLLAIFVNIVLPNNDIVEFKISNLVEIFVLYILSYIFEYGYYLQKDSNLKMYE